MKRFPMSGRAAGILLISILSQAALAKDSIPPSKPANFSATEVSPNTVELTWGESSDNRRVRHYLLYRDSVQIAKTRKLQWLDKNLYAGTHYQYSIVASDGFNTSAVNTTDIVTAAPPVEPPIEPPPEPLPEPTPGTGAPSSWSVVFSDEFSGNGALDTSSADKNWRFESMQDALHRAGNKGMDEYGSTDVAEWVSAKGKRWSAWYDQHHGLNAYRDNGWLVMGGYFSGEQDPTRPLDYMDEGVLTQYGSSKLYTAWIDTWSRTWSNEHNRHIVDPQSPARTFKYGYFETRLDFSMMKTPGFRLSMWLMPATSDEAGNELIVDSAYDIDGNNGVEIDIFEYEWISTERENDIHVSVHGGAAGSSQTTVDTATHGISLHSGVHTIGFLWQADKLVWSIDGKVIKTMSNENLIPDVYSYLIVSREMNSGVKDPDSDTLHAGDMLANPPYIPRDPGMYAKNIWQHRDRIDSDQALIDYIRVWQP